MTLHIISDPGNVTRTNHLFKELKRQGITDYKLWPAIFVPNKPARTGTSRAHKAIVEWAMIEQLTEICIAEDDFFLPADDGFKYFLDNKPKEPFDIYLGCISQGQIDNNNFTKRYTGQILYIISERYYPTFLK